MTLIERLRTALNTLRMIGVVKTQRDFAALIGRDETTISRALKEDDRYLTDNLVERAEAAVREHTEEEDKEKRFLNLAMVEKQPENESGVVVPLIPTGARAGTLADFAEAVKEYDVEKIVSPVRGADYAIQVTGDSMAPEYEPGCHVLIKKVFEDQFIEWGKTYVLDSDNGAVIKKIFPTEDAAVVECRSVNPAYPPFRVRTEHVHGWYRVLMIMALK